MHLLQLIIKNTTLPSLRESLSQALTWGGAWSVYIWPDGHCEYVSGLAIACDLGGISKRLVDEGAALLFNHHAAADGLTCEESMRAQEETEACAAAVEKLIADCRLEAEVAAYVSA